MKVPVVPPGWAARHQPVVEGFFGSTIRLERQTGRTVDDLDVTGTWEIVYEGPGLVELADVAPAVLGSVGRRVVVATYVGRMPMSVDPQVGDRVECVASPDSRMVGKRFVVEHDETQDYAVDRQVRLTRTSAPK